MANLITYEDLAKKINVKKATLYAWVHLRQIPFIRFSKRMVRFEEEEIEKWLQNKSKPERSTP